MKTNQRYFYILFLSVSLILVCVLCAQVADDAPPCFYIESPYTSTTEDISIFDDNNGNYYVFLPSYADLGQVTVSLPKKYRFSLGDTALRDGMDCSGFELETPYDFTVNGKKVASLWFYQSANVATMYIDTVTNSMEQIHEDKNYKEFASLSLYAADGTLDFQNKLVTLKGRGNATWIYDKRPYSLKLSNDGDLLDMGPATNWVLLANAYDETNLNNKLILDLAARVGFQWTPESRWVDLYLNGEYNGLYLLTEKVEVHDNRLNIHTNAGDFLCKIDLSNRWEMLQNPFSTEALRTIEICSPEVLTETEQTEIERLVNQMEQTLLSGADLQNEAIIDLDSWVRRYLIDEIAGNIDSDLTSSYFYYSDGVFFAGPIWDYDKALGNDDRNQAPCSFIAKNAYKSSTYLSPYYGALYANESFNNRMQEIYRAEFAPILQELIDHELVDQINYISNASQSNSLRWRSMFDTMQSWSQDTVHTNESLREYLSQRISFLNSAWLNNIAYCTVQFESSPGAPYWNISVPKGHCLDTTHVDLISTIWVDAETGKAFDFSQPVLTDMILTKQITDEFEVSANADESVNAADTDESPDNVNADDSLVTPDYFTPLSIALLITMLMGFVMIDLAQRRRDRRAAGG